jgi:hypothetical protein
MATPSAGDLRNFALVGHASSGKTTLSEAMLACAGVIGRMGNIAQGTRRRFLSTLPSLPQLFHLVFRFSFSFLSLFNCFHANCVSGLRSVNEDVHLLTNEQWEIRVLDLVDDLQNARIDAFGAVSSE